MTQSTFLLILSLLLLVTAVLVSVLGYDLLLSAVLLLFGLDGREQREQGNKGPVIRNSIRTTVRQYTLPEAAKTTVVPDKGGTTA